MVNTSSAKTLLPQVDGRALDFIKIAAAIFMVIDHINLIWFNSEVQGMFFVGRATFPLFCYALAIALIKAGSEKASGYVWRKYIPRLLLLAIISEAVCRITRDVDMLNVIFTLALAAGMAGLSYRLKDWQLIVLCITAVILGDQFAVWISDMHLLPEFGPAGIMLPTAIMMYIQGRKGGLFCILALIAVMNLAGYSDALTTLSTPVAFFIALIWFSSTALPLWVIKWSQRLPNDGRLLHKYALHIFYPGHLLVLWGLLQLKQIIETAS